MLIASKPLPFDRPTHTPSSKKPTTSCWPSPFTSPSKRGCLLTCQPCPAELKSLVHWTLGANSLSLNVAPTVLSAVILTTQAPVPKHAPPQPAKKDPEAGVALNVTWVF